MSRRAILATTLIVAAVALAVVIGWPHLQVYVGSAPPRQIDEPLGVTLPPGTGANVLGLAHNAGNSFETLRAARAAGADVIEIDLMSVRGELVAGREQPLPALARALFRGETLEDLWPETEGAIVKLDLKQDDQAFVDKVIEFVRSHPDSKLMISTPDRTALLRIDEKVPRTELLFSVSNPDSLGAFRLDPKLLAAADGVSVFRGLIDAGLISWAHAESLIVLAWTANDGAEVSRLVRLGVDGITTANLAALRALA